VNSLTPEEASILASFETWLKTLFNSEGFLHKRKMAFSVVTHTDQYGNITINNGKYILVIRRTDVKDETRYGVCNQQGQIIVPGDTSLAKSLIRTLGFAIEEHFTENHKS